MGLGQIGKAPLWHFRLVDWFKTNSFIAFLEQLLQHYNGTKIHFIPPYSLKLNAGEYRWRKTKKATTHNLYFAKFEELVLARTGQFARFQGNPASISKSIPHFAEAQVFMQDTIGTRAS
jgi:hypothetical protein